VTEYEFDDSFLISGELKVKTFDAYTEEWAQFIFLNRNNREAIQQHDYDIVYNSDTFAKLSDPETGLFFQSPGYVYSYLESEIPKEKVQLL
jgi:hypothetical protein